MATKFQNESASPKAEHGHEGECGTHTPPSTYIPTIRGEPRAPALSPTHP